jgi:hypothetical protein
MGEVKGLARGGAPLMRGAHNTTQGSNTCQMNERGVSSRRGMPHMSEVERGVYQSVKWQLRKGAPHV